MEPLKRGDRVTLVHVYDPPYSGFRFQGSTYEVILVDGLYVQLWAKRWPFTHRYHAVDMGAEEVILRPAHDATTPASYGSSIRVKRSAP